MSYIKSVLKGLKDSFKGFKLFNWFIYILGLIVLIIPFIFIGKWWLLILSVIVLIVVIIAWFSNNRFVKDCSGNGVIFGGRGKGKGLLFQKRINADKEHFSNIKFNDKTKIINIKEYIQSIGSNTIHDMINNTVKVVKKIDKFEGVNVYWDDVNIYAPNFMDNELKKHYPSLPLTLAVNRHLYDASMIINSQAVDRPYKILRELQTDFSIKAIKAFGTYKSFIWNSLPFLRFFIGVQYIYYEEKNSAEKGLLPFNAKAIANEALKHGYLTSGQATKEQFKAMNGRIYKGYILMRKNKVNYDDRFFHEMFYGVSAKKYLEDKNKSIL